VIAEGRGNWDELPTARIFSAMIDWDLGDLKVGNYQKFSKWAKELKKMMVLDVFNLMVGSLKLWCKRGNAYKHRDFQGLLVIFRLERLKRIE
jgi:hypothetical protein